MTQDATASRRRSDRPERPPDVLAHDGPADAAPQPGPGGRGGEADAAEPEAVPRADGGRPS